MIPTDKSASAWQECKSGQAVGGVDRRRFLRDSGLATAAIAGLQIDGSPARTQIQRMPMPNTLPYDPAKDIPHPTISRQFARWVTTLRYEDLPPDVVDRAKGVTLHAPFS